MGLVLAGALFSHQKVALFEGIRIRRHGLAGVGGFVGSVSL